MRGKGINYDTGFYPGGVSSREHFDPALVGREMRVIADDLHCTAVRISGGDPGRLSVAGSTAAAAGLEVWFAPFPCELTTGGPGPAVRGLRGPRRAAAPLRGSVSSLVCGCELIAVRRGVPARWHGLRADRRPQGRPASRSAGRVRQRCPAS